MSFEATDFLGNLYAVDNPTEAPDAAGPEAVPPAPTLGQPDAPAAGETLGGGLPPGWPVDVAEPDWWPELASLGIPIRRARPDRCDGCGFGVAVNWQDGTGRWEWSCPSCGRRSEGATGPEGSDPTHQPEPDDGEPLGDWACARCGSMVWWEDLAGGKHCQTCEADKEERADRLAERARRLRQATGLPPEHTEPRPGECPRCRGTDVRDVPIHDGQSDRRDCAGCGRFIAFVRWGGQELSPTMLTGERATAREELALQNRPESTQSGLSDSEHVERNSPSPRLPGAFSKA